MKNAVGRLSNETSASMSHDQLQDTLVSAQSLALCRKQLIQCKGALSLCPF